VKIEQKNPPRTYRCGVHGQIEIKDCARIELDPDDQVTFVTDSGTEYDVARKIWGYYATPSMNSRLPTHGLHPVLAMNGSGSYFVLLIETGHETACQEYLTEEGMTIVAHLDDVEHLGALQKTFQGCK